MIVQGKEVLIARKGEKVKKEADEEQSRGEDVAGKRSKKNKRR